MPYIYSNHDVFQKYYTVLGPMDSLFILFFYMVFGVAVTKTSNHPLKGFSLSIDIFKTIKYMYSTQIGIYQISTETTALIQRVGILQ